MSIAIRNLQKSFGGFRALDGVTLDVHDGELVALLGPSGCGKTTLLRVVAGLEQPDSGSVTVESNVGFVFQHYALFRHMNVFENIAFGLRVKPRAVRMTKSGIADRVQEMLRLVQLENFARHMPQQLSGGQRQRVALARALAVQPRILLLDEPFGALDTRVRIELRRWLRRLHDEIRLTSIFVTHDQEEALEVADRLVVMHRGRVEQIGTPDEVFESPRTDFVLRFMGTVNEIDGALVRPHEVLLTKGDAPITALVGKITRIGAAVRIQLETEGGRSIDAEISREQFAALALEKGSKVGVTANSRNRA